MALTLRETLIAVVVVFIGWGYATYWVPLLRYLGYAFVAGAFVATSLTGLITLLSVRDRNVNSASTRSHHAFFIEPKSWEEETEWLSNMGQARKAALYPSSFEVSASIDELLDWMLRDFISSWYSNISTDTAFRNRIEVAIRQALNTLRARIESQDFVEALILRVTPILTTHLKTFNEAELAVRGKTLNRSVTDSEELDLSIASKYNNGVLHQAASLSFSDTKAVQQEYLRKICVRLMPHLVSETILQSRAVSVLVREIVACAVLSPIVQLLSDPDTWNRMVESYGKSTLKDRKHVRKLRAALDEHASPQKRPQPTFNFPKLSPNDDERKFERFIRAIRQCDNLSDARRFRSEVASQLARESILQNNDQTYIRRLETGKRILDQRVGMLGAVGGSSTSKAPKTMANTPTTKSRMMTASLKEILYDAAGLSYFMEYMDRHRRMSLVQFWIVVDGFRNPLEEDAVGDSESSNVSVKWSPSDRQDIAQISEAYLSKPEIKAPREAQQQVQEFLRAESSATSTQYSTARSAILSCQTAVFEELRNKYFANFRKSDLFFKLLSREEGSTMAVEKSSPSATGPTHKRPSLAAIHEATPTSDLNVQRSMSTEIDRSHLRRNALSSTNLASADRDDDFLAPHPRRSLDVDTTGPLFRDEIEPEGTLRPLFGSESDLPSLPDAGANQDQIEAMEAALNTIISDPQDDDFKDVSHESDGILSRSDVFKERNSGEFRRIGSVASTDKVDRPNLASLGLVNTSSRIGVFTDNDLFNDEEKFLEDEQVDSDHETAAQKDEEEEIHEAAPGDLGLAEAISALSVDIDRLAAQDSIVDTLTRKAELTNNVAELRILGKSKTSIQKELRRKELQRQQYIVQESDNSLFGRATVNIKSLMVGKDEDGQEYALYVIEVQRKAGEAMSAAVWAVARRYSEFHDLHQRLRQRYAGVRSLEFPRRRLVMKLQREFLDKRRIALEHYLRELLHLPDVCRSRDLRAFLSQRPIDSSSPGDGSGKEADLVSRIYNSVTDGMDEFLGNIPVLDQLSTAGQNLISAATSQYYNRGFESSQPTSAIGDPASRADDANVQEARAVQAEIDAFENQALEPFIKPISDLFLETFELNRSQNWLRGRAVVVVLHQLIGGTVERKVREAVSSFTNDEHLLKYLGFFKDNMWPGGVLQRDRPPRTKPERKTSQREAGAVLSTLMPDLVGGVVGRSNAAAAARRLFATMNNERLNTHLVFSILDEVVNILFAREH